MKITDFLKKFTLINSKFIDDFYSFYDEVLVRRACFKQKLWDVHEGQ